MTVSELPSPSADSPPPADPLGLPVHKDDLVTITAVVLKPAPKRRQSAAAAEDAAAGAPAKRKRDDEAEAAGGTAGGAAAAAGLPTAPESFEEAEAVCYICKARRRRARLGARDSAPPCRGHSLTPPVLLLIDSWR